MRYSRLTRHIAGFDDESSSGSFRLPFFVRVLLILYCAIGSLAANNRQSSNEMHAVTDGDPKGFSPTIVGFQLIAHAVVVHVKLNGRGPYALLFDSGAVNFISPQTAEELGLAVGDSEEGFGIGKRTVIVGETEVESVQIGKAVLHGQRFHVVPLPYVMEHGFPEAIVGGASSRFGDEKCLAEY